jgi:hypothetical protein
MHLSRLVAVSIEEVAFIGYDDATGDQHVLHALQCRPVYAALLRYAIPGQLGAEA